MTRKHKGLANPFSTGGGGYLFEAHVQAAFVALMLTGGCVPCMPCWPVKKIKLQGRFAGYDTDDLLVIVASEDGPQERKLLAQIKHSITITARDRTFREVIQAAWNDFQDDKLFTRGRDVLTLITGPLSAADITDVRQLLEYARHADGAGEFFTKMNRGKFTSNGQRRKLHAFRAQLQAANDGIEVSEEVTYEFLTHFHLLGFDLDKKAGVTLSLLHSLIGQNRSTGAHALWTMLVDEVQSANKNAGTLTEEGLSEPLRTAFMQQPRLTIPPEYTVPQATPSEIEVTVGAHATKLAVAALVGAWNENSQGDRAIVELLARDKYSAWIRDLRESLQQPGAPLSLIEGKWRVSERLVLWRALGPRIFDDDLAAFRRSTVSVLIEDDPKFDLPAEERWAATVHGKTLRHSQQLRRGLAETLAILGTHPDSLTRCSTGKAESTAALTVRAILEDAGWVRWASLCELLPLLAEAAPGEYLSAIEHGLTRQPSPFDEIFAQEGGGIMGRSYMSGVLWGLETLAWDTDQLSRVVMCLGELSSRDPGGRWANRPAKSLTTILLPWMPQTLAPLVRREAAVSELLTEFPSVAWKLLVSLLPRSRSSTAGTRKPAWRGTIPDGWARGVPQQEYWDQVASYSEMAITAAKNNLDRLVELVAHIDHLLPPAREQLLAHLGSESAVALSEADRLRLWNELIDLTARHKKYASATWAMTSDQVEKIATLASRLAPKGPASRHQRLFRDRDLDVYDEKGTYEEQSKELENRRQSAVREIAASGGAQAVLAFAETVQTPLRVGIAFGALSGNEVDGIVLPSLLEYGRRPLGQFAAGYVWSRFRVEGWNWVDGIADSHWTPEQIGQFLSFLPFDSGTWERSRRLLAENEAAYWSKTSAKPYESTSGLQVAIDLLVRYGRPNAAMRCLNKVLHDNQPFDSAQAARALLAALGSSEGAKSMDAYEIVEIIKAMQDSPSTNPDDLFRVEWAYLPLLDRDENAAPKLLERRLATEPTFFCEVIRLVFRSRKEASSTEGPTEAQRKIATNAFRLLNEWGAPPGLGTDGTFDGDTLNSWLKAVVAECSETGHREVALTIIGQVLTHVPPDPSGLWIHRSAATVLNAKDAREMREGFRTELFNSRGAHIIDPTGEPEREFAQKYRSLADAVETGGYHRLATTLRELASSYEYQAERLMSRADLED